MLPLLKAEETRVITPLYFLLQDIVHKSFNQFIAVGSIQSDPSFNLFTALSSNQLCFKIIIGERRHSP